MLLSPGIPIERAWNTWSARPLEVVFLPLGIRLTPLAYAASTGRATLFPSGPALRFGRHATDGSLVEAEAEHAGTRLAFRYDKPDPFRLIGHWHTLARGEWGLRFWLNLCLSAECGTHATYDPATGATFLKIGHRSLALVSQAAAVQVTGHETIEQAAQDYETNGYFDTRTRSHAAPVLMLRFNLEMMPTNSFAAAIADSPGLALENARAALAQPPRSESLPTQTGHHAGSLDAIRDVMAWNTVWDEINGRPYTSISRNWNLAKFGGYGVWLNDQLFHTLLASLIDPILARQNLATVLASATPQGNLACLLTARDAWVDRSQPPIGAFILRLLHLRLGARDLLQLAYPALARNHAWWWQHRDPDHRHLCSYGTSEVGEALYLGTAFGARNESCQDNAPVHDEAVYDPATRCLSTLDIGLNSLLALDAEMLAAIAAELGKAEEAAAHAAIAARTRALVRDTLWDESRHIFANRQRTGGFVRSLSPTSFYPLIAGIASPEQTAQLIAHLENPEMFGGNFTIPSVARNDPAYADNTYWRGRIWPPLNYLVWQGLRRTGAFARATALAEASLALFTRAWAASRLCPENFSAETGDAFDQPDTDSFYGWGALMPLMAVSEISDISPWHGWTITNTGADALLANIETPIGLASITIRSGILTLFRGDQKLFETTILGRLEQIVWTSTLHAMTLPPCDASDIVFPGLRPSDIAHLTLDGAPAAFSPAETGLRLALPSSAAPRRLSLIENTGPGP